MVHNAGSLNIDIVLSTSHIVRPGETISSSGMKRFTGGKGLNQSVALFRAGVPVRHVGRVGEDGGFLLESLKAEGLDTSSIVSSTEASGQAIIQVAADGENSIVLFGGANQTWGPDDVEAALYPMSAGDVLLLQNEINVVPELMHAAYEGGVKIAINPAPFGPEVLQYPLQKAHWIIVNEIEGRSLAGTAGEGMPESTGGSASGADIADVQVLEILGRRYPSAIIVMTLGARGAIRYENGILSRAEFPAPGPVVDTTAAGDTFVGYYLAAEIAGCTPEQCLQRACAAGALAVTREGATPGIPHETEVDVLVNPLG